MGSVAVSDGVLMVEGKHEERAEDGSKMVARSFSRKYSLPASAEPDQVASNLSSDGVLVITAPRRLSLSSSSPAAPSQSTSCLITFNFKPSISFVKKKDFYQLMLHRCIDQ